MSNTSISVSSNTLHRKRYAEFDVLRTISMLLMVVAHVWEQFDPYIAENVLINNRWFTFSYAFIGPSVLMICLGTNLSFSRNVSPRNLIKRGILFLGIDALLNIVRFGVPAFVLAIAGRPEFISGYFLLTLLGSDIYAFVGAFFILYGLLKKWNLGSVSILVLSLITISVNTLFSFFYKAVYTPLLTRFLGRFFWVASGSFFSLFPWLVFPAIGCCFGDFYKMLTAEKQHRFSIFVLSGSILGTVIFSIALINYGISPTIAVITLNDYKVDLFSVILMVFLAGIAFGLAHLFVTQFSSSLVIKISTKISKVIMPFYVIQWIMVAWIQFTLEGMRLYGLFQSSLSVYMVAVTLIVVSLVLSFQFEKIKNRRRMIS